MGEIGIVLWEGISDHSLHMKLGTTYTFIFLSMDFYCSKHQKVVDQGDGLNSIIFN